MHGSKVRDAFAQLREALARDEIALNESDAFDHHVQDARAAASAAAVDERVMERGRS